MGAVFDGVRVIMETVGIVEKTTPVERLAAGLEKNFEVSHAAGSTVMDISFKWSDPEIAQAVVKDWVETYINERTEALGDRPAPQLVAALQRGLARPCEVLVERGAVLALQRLAGGLHGAHCDARG